MSEYENFEDHYLKLLIPNKTHEIASDSQIKTPRLDYRLYFSPKYKNDYQTIAPSC